MKSILIKMRKGKKSFDWNETLTPSCQALEIISPSLCQLEDKFDLLPNLKSLTLVCPQLTQLPSSLYQCKQLEVLKIKNANLLHIEQQCSLNSLRIAQFANLGLSNLPPWISENIFLETLDIHGNQLFDLPLNFEKLQNLKRLNLDNNHFDSLPWELEKISSLNHLSLDGNNFDQSEKERISTVFNYNF